MVCELQFCINLYNMVVRYALCPITYGSESCVLSSLIFLYLLVLTFLSLEEETIYIYIRLNRDVLTNR